MLTHISPGISQQNHGGEGVKLVSSRFPNTLKMAVSLTVLKPYLRFAIIGIVKGMD